MIEEQEAINKIQPKIENARWVLSEFSDGETPTDYPWFGCDSDLELAQLIIGTAQGEGFNGNQLSDEDFDRTLRIMYFG